MALTSLAAGWLGLCGGSDTLPRALQAAFVFAGFPALLTGAGVGRLAARAATVNQPEPDSRYAGKVGARQMAMAGGGLIILAALPLGNPPEGIFGWIGLVLLGAVSGWVCGTVVGRWAATGKIVSR